MATVIDSKITPLPAPTIIMTAISELPLYNVPPAAAMAAIAAEINMPNTDLFQVGNTLFIGHRGTDENKEILYGRAFNIDTARNFINNGLTYLAHLQKIGIKQYVTDYEGDTYDAAFMIVDRFMEKGDSEIRIARSKKTNNTRVYVAIGELPVKKAN